MKRLVVSLLLVLLGTSGVAFAADVGWVLTTDYSTFGRLDQFDLQAPWSVAGDQAVVPGDAVGRHHGDRVYVVGRSGASLLQEYDPADDLALVREFSLGAGRNPQDIAFDSQGEAYVSCYDAALLLRVDVSGESVLQTIDTSSFADADGLPETAWMVARGDLLYIACQKLDRNTYLPSGPGAVLVFDMATEQWVDQDAGAPGVQPIALSGANPFPRLELVTVNGSPRLRAGCVGRFGLSDGGIEEVDLTTGVSLGYLVSEADLGGDVTAFISTGPDQVHAIMSSATLVSSLRRWRSGEPVAVLATESSAYYADLAWDGDTTLYLASRTSGAAGLRVFDAASGAELTTGPLLTGLEPASFIMPAVGGASPVPVPSPGAGLALSAPYPNPCNPAASLAIDGTPGSLVTVTVFDLAGRRVAGRRLPLDGSGQGRYRFTGRDPNGATLAAGVYRVVAQDGRRLAVRSVTLLK